MLRYGVLYGPDVPTTQALVRALRWRVLPRMRGVNGLTSFIHIADATSATLAALEHGRPGAIYNIVDDEPANMEDFVGDAARTIGVPRPFAIPFQWLEVVAPVLAAFWAGEMGRVAAVDLQLLKATRPIVFGLLAAVPSRPPGAVTCSISGGEADGRPLEAVASEVSCAGLLDATCYLAQA